MDSKAKKFRVPQARIEYNTFALNKYYSKMSLEQIIPTLTTQVQNQTRKSLNKVWYFDLFWAFVNELIATIE